MDLQEVLAERKRLTTYVEDEGKRYLFHYGEGFIADRLPKGTRVLYPPPPLRPVRDVRGAIEQALEHPLGADPLRAQLRPGMRVTIAFDDISLPLPPMRAPDLRQQAMEIILDKLARAGVDDVHLIAANSLHRRMTAPEIRRVVGRRIFNAFFPRRLYNHDAEDPAAVAFLGRTDRGEVVEINRRAAESDLLIYVNLTLVTMDGGHKSVPVGLGTYRSLRHHHNVHTLMRCLSYMDPPNSALHHSCERMGRLVADHVNVFAVETSLNNDTFPHALGFLQKPEVAYGLFDWLNLAVNKTATDLMPRPLGRKVFAQMRAPYGLTGIHAGRTDLVHERTLEHVLRQHLVPVEGQSDIVIAGLPYLSPYNVNSIMNPILVMCLGLGYAFNMYRGRPLVRPGGIMIFLHPLTEEFHPVHHPSYIEFYERVLAETTDAVEIERRHEEAFAADPRYIAMYRHGHAYHGVHPFYMWYWGCYALKYLSKVIFVRPESERAARRMGFETAPTLAEAIARARGLLGEGASITYYHWPPLFLCDVT